MNKDPNSHGQTPLSLSEIKKKRYRNCQDIISELHRNLMGKKSQKISDALAFKYLISEGRKTDNRQKPCFLFAVVIATGSI